MGHPLLDLTNKTAVVIGGTSGIGLALTKALAQAGANVVPSGRRAEQVPPPPPRSRRSAGGRSSKLAMSRTPPASTNFCKP